MRTIAAKLFIFFICCLGLAACGKDTDNTQEVPGITSDGGEYVYMPTFWELDPLEGIEGERYMVRGVLPTEEQLYYAVKTYDEGSDMYIFYRSYQEFLIINQIPTRVLQASGAPFVDTITEDGAGNLYVLWSDYIEAEEKSYDYLSRISFNKISGSYVADYKVGLDDLWVNKWNNYFQKVVVDKEGNFYGVSDNLVYVFDAEGNFLRTIEWKVNNLNSLLCTEDGRILVGTYNRGSYQLAPWDPNTGEVEDAFANLPEGCQQVWPARENKVLVSDGKTLFTYDVGSGESHPLLNWLDSNISVGNIRSVGMTENEGIAVVSSQSGENPFITKYEFALLSKVEKSKVPIKEVITLAIVAAPSDELNRAVVEFNKANHQYRVEIKSYLEDQTDWSKLTDARNRLMADLVSGNGPDLIYLEHLDWVNLAKKGVLEELTPYLTREGGIGKEDFLEAVIKAYEIEGSLYTIPRGFTLNTLMGKEAVVNTLENWTFADIKTLMQDYPETALIYGMDAYSFIRMYMQYGEAIFVDENNQCHFDGPEFAELLTFVTQGENALVMGFSPRADFLLNKYHLLKVDITGLEAYQMYFQFFKGEGTLAGYPTADGSRGVLLEGSEMMAISSQSTKKEGAWAFLEVYLQGEVSTYWQMPTLVSAFEEITGKAMTVEYEYDKEGNIKYDKAGNPVQKVKTQYGHYDFNADIYALTEEELEGFYELLKHAVRGNSESMITQIVIEEVSPFLSGQKTAEEVAAIIQSRVQLYLDENY